MLSVIILLRILWANKTYFHLPGYLQKLMTSIFDHTLRFIHLYNELKLITVMLSDLL